MRLKTGDFRRRLGQSIREADPQVILRVASLCDGHTIFHPQLFMDAGLPTDVAQLLSREHRSDYKHPKSTLFRQGKPVSSITGIYGLQLLRFIADVLELKVPSKFGRGSEAEAIKQALQLHLREHSGGTFPQRRCAATAVSMRDANPLPAASPHEVPNE